MLNDKSILKIGTDQLWIIVILAGFLFYVSLIPLPPNDFWWHLKIGEFIYIEKYIPTTNLFAWTLPEDAPFYYASWLGELLFYVLYRIGGLEIIIFARNLLAGITFGLVGYLSKEKSGSWRIAAITTTIACIMSMNNLPVRTQVWAWVPFVLFLLILNIYIQNNRSYKLLVLLPLIMVFWVNVHGTFILGFILLGIYSAGEVVQRLIDRSKAIEWRKIIGLFTVSIASVLAIFINPRGFQITGYVSGILSNQPIQSFIEEWLPPTPSGIANVMFFSSVIVLIVIFAYSRIVPRVTEIFLIVAFLWLAFNGQRSVIWYAVVSAPILAKGVALLPVKPPNLPVQYRTSNLLISLIIFIPVILIQPWFIRNFPLPQTYLDQVILDSKDGPFLSKHTPTEAIDYLHNNPGGKIFNEMGYGSYIIWKHPELGTFIDPRIELFPYELWIDYIHISKGTRYSALLNAYDIDRIILDKVIQPELVSSLAEDPNWVIEFESGFTQIWKRFDR